MNKNVVSKILVGIFVFFILVFVGFGIIGIINQNKDEEEQRAHYQQMIKDGSKTLLTADILEEDHNAYLERVAQSTKTLYIVLAIFIAIVIDFILMIIFSTVIRGMEDGVSGTSFIITLAIFAAAMFCIVTFLIIAARFIIPQMKGVRPEKEAYFYDEIVLSDSKKVEKLVESGTGESRTSHTEIHYYIIDENGNEIETSKVLYERFLGEGLYYVGKTSSEVIFSLYPDKYFELEQLTEVD